MKTKEWLILTPQYQQLHKELYNAFITEDTPVQKRGRPAKRARKKETSSNPSSTEENKTTTEET